MRYCEAKDSLAAAEVLFVTTVVWPSDVLKMATGRATGGGGGGGSMPVV